MATQNVKARTGNRIRILLDGKVVGALQKITATDDYGIQPVQGIGDIHTLEYVPTKADHELLVESAVLFSGTLRDAGVALENGDAALSGLIFDIEIYDKDGGGLLRKYTGCRMSKGTVTVDKNTVVLANATFKALDATGTAV